MLEKRWNLSQPGNKTNWKSWYSPYNTEESGWKHSQNLQNINLSRKNQCNYSRCL